MKRATWQIKELKNALPDLPEYPQLILRLLSLRGLTTPEQIADFLNPDYAKLHDPFAFVQMQKAVERIRRAIESKEKITIYADYDADAITACAVVYLGLKKLGVTAEYYIPDRFTEGYGMNEEAVRKIAETGSKLIITVDCGTNAVREATLCAELGLDLIITDHHEITGELPSALALINPKNSSDAYPFAFLTGVGVAFKLIQALITDGWERWLLDLVAIGTVADLQSLTGENRILVEFGLRVLAKTRWNGLKALLSQAQLRDQKYDTFTLGFILAPRINAAGRIKHADSAFQTLVEEDLGKAEVLAAELTELNKHRQTLTEQILSEAKAQVEMNLEKKVLMVFGADWPKGVVGLVAGKLAEEYNRPTLAVSVDADGRAVGSARSTPDFDIVAALGQAKEFLEKYGGHTQAAGFSLKQENMTKLHQSLLEYAENLDLNITKAVLSVDAELGPEEITWQNLEYIDRMAPFGIGNPRPKFLSQGLEVIDFRTVGGNNQHLKLTVKFGNHKLGAIAFNKGFFTKELASSKTIDAVYELTQNEWNGNKDIQLKIIDLRVHED